MNPYAYASVVLIWGTTPLGIQWSSESTSPFFAALLRMLIAFAVLLACLRVFRIQFDLSKQAQKIYAVSVLGQGASMLLCYWAASYLPSSLISLLFGFSPLLTGILVWFFYKERLNLFQCAAIVSGILGLTVVMSSQLTFDGAGDYHFMTAVGVLLVAVVLFCLSNIWIKRFSEGTDIHPLSLTTGSLMFALPLYVVCFAFDNQHVEWTNISIKSASAIVYLALIASVIAPYCFFLVLKTTSASMVALITVMAPVVALFLAAFLNNEPVGLHLIAGTILVISSLLLFQFESFFGKKLEST